MSYLSAEGKSKCNFYQLLDTCRKTAAVKQLKIKQEILYIATNLITPRALFFPHTY